MKKIFPLVISGMFGGLVVLVGLNYFHPAAPMTMSAKKNGRLVNQINVSPKTNAAPFDFREAAAEAMPAVVHIASKATQEANQPENNDSQNDFFRFFFDDDRLSNPYERRGPSEGSGSGVIYSSDGYIVTNNHVVEFADNIEVTLFDNRTFEASIVGTYEQSDLAVIKIEANDLAAIDLADSDQVEVGQWVLAVGNPFELTSTVTAGIVSAKGRSIQLLGGGDAIEAFIQTDAAVNPGNSGGALVDTEGNLVGINTAIATRTGVFQGYSFAIPTNLVKRIIDDIIATGSFKRAFLGVVIVEMDSDYAKELEVNTAQGVVIESLSDGGSAQYAGLQPKDIIVEVDDKTIRTVPELQEVIGRARVDDVIKITVIRRGEKMDIPVILKPR